MSLGGGKPAVAVAGAHGLRVDLELCWNVQGEDLTTYGELVAEGAFRMYGAKAPRHVFLLDQMLLICKRKEDGTLGYKAHIMVRLRFYSL